MEKQEQTKEPIEWNINIKAHSKEAAGLLLLEVGEIFYKIEEIIDWTNKDLGHFYSIKL